MAEDTSDSLDFNVGPAKEGDTQPLTTPDGRNPLSAVTTTPTGAATISVSADPIRKGPDFPNEDAIGAKTVTIAADANPGELLTKVIGNIAASHQTRDDGTTIAASIITKDTLYTATMGDSPVFVISYDPGAEPGASVQLKQINTDHVASDEVERNMLPDPSLARQTETGRWRVFSEQTGGGIMLTRAIGDRDFKLNPTPDIKTYDLGADAKAGKIDFVVSASDGAVERTTPADIEQMLNRLFKDSLASVGQIPSAEEIAYHMATHRYDKSTDSVEPYRRNDDTSVVVQPVADLQTEAAPGGKQNITLITTADGHGFKKVRDNDGVLQPKYDDILSQTVVAETERYVQNPHLMRDATRLRQ